MSADAVRMRGLVDRMIFKYGMTCALRRTVSGVIQDRPCVAAIIRWRPEEREGKLVNQVNRIAYVSTKGVTLPPNQELDALVTFKQDVLPVGSVVDEVCKQIAPPGKVAPGGIVIYWELSLEDT